MVPRRKYEWYKCLKDWNENASIIMRYQNVCLMEAVAGIGRNAGLLASKFFW